MTRSSSRHGHSRSRVLARIRLGTAAVTTAALMCMLTVAPASASSLAAGARPGVRMFGYAAGPRQHEGTAAHHAHSVPAAATRARSSAKRIKGHPAPKPDLAPPAMAARTLVRTGSVRMAPGHEVADHQIVRRSPSRAGHPTTTPPATTPPATRSPRPSTSPTPSPTLSSTVRTADIFRSAAGSTDNASYSVAATFDTVPMADQNGRIAVTLTNSGTSTWSTGYALGTQVFASSDTTGTGTPLTTGAKLAISASVTPGGTATVESVTPAENPGSYTICWDMVNAAGEYFSAEGGNEYCAPYTVAQYAPTVNEQEPLPGTDVDSQYPTLSASAIVPGGYPAEPAFSYAFEIYSSATENSSTLVASSGWVADNGSSWTSTKSLTWGDTYYWQVTVSDAATPPSLVGSGITWTTPISFVVGDAQATVSSRLGNAYQADDGNPIMTSDLGSSDYDGSGKTVDPQTGNVSQQVTDADVATVGPPLSIMRTYNSLDPRTSQAFGAGWSSLLDMSLVPDPDGSGALILTLADGQQVRFAKNAAGGYAPPDNMYAVITAVSGGGFSVTDQTGTAYTFAQASGSSWLISKIIDEVGRTETFTYSSGVLTTITSSASGRSLHVTWTTPSGATYPHVATVSTDPVTAGQSGTALTWTYGYKGDLLTSVCSPASATACTTYGYITNGSHAPTSVRNADPTSYYRLDDPATATAAANEIPVDDLTTMNPPATEMNTTPGVAGPVSGVTATSFNGTSSFIPLDGAWCTTPSQESSCTQIGDTGRLSAGSAGGVGISIWFKTSTASGVLLGLASDLPPAQNCAPYCIANTADPLLWIGSNGDLDGAGASTTPLSSSTPVDNGAWHQAVLIPGQALYLDGKKVASASGSGSFTVPADSYVLLGAGLITQNVLYSSWEYFKGSMADVSIYQNQLPSVGTVAAQYAAETQPAAELTSITSPAGRSEFSATYDTVNDRVATIADANGGTWTYGGLAPGASSGAYDSAVMGSSPQDFWPLNDTVGPLAHDLVGGAATAARPRPPATYANVTLGAAGPTGFADGTAARFSGSSSQISIPGGYFAGSGPESAELWFNTTKAGTLLSSSSGPTGGNPLTLWINSEGCLEGSIGSAQLTGGFGLCGAAVDNGNWHQAVLSLGPVITTPGFLGGPGTSSQTATLYLDGAELTTAQMSTPATPSATGYTAYIGNGSDGDFSGSIADVSFYAGELSSTEVASHYSALQNQISVEVPNTNPFDPPTYLATPTLNVQTATVTDPVGKNAVYMYAGGALVRTTSVLGGVTSYGYDAADRASTITDPDGDTTYLTYDAHNNVTSTTTCAAPGACQTSYASYYEDLANPLDPRNDKVTDSRDQRSSSPTDPTYDTVTTYTTNGQVAAVTTPSTAACPSGCATTSQYTMGTQAAVGGGDEPPGLLASVTAPRGGVTSYAYDSSGDLMQVTDPLGLVTKYTYDNLGRELTSTEVSNSYPAGLTTSYTYNTLGLVATQKDPPVTDRVTGAVHTELTTYAYDPDGNVLTAALSDTTGGDPPRTTTYTYNAHDEVASSSDALGNTTTYTYDALGDLASETNPAQVTTAYTYDAAGDVLTKTLDGYTGNPSAPIAAENLVEESWAYDPAGRLASVTTVAGTTTAYTYYGNNQLASSYVVDGTGTEEVTSYGYDAAGNQVTETDPSGLVTNTAYNADDQPVSQTADPTGVDRTSTATYDADGNIVADSLTGGGVTQTVTATYNAMDEELSQTVDNTGGNLTTTYVRDQRGLVTSETDPDGSVTGIQNDQDGRPVVETDPATATDSGTGTVVTASPVTMIGYDTFGDQTETSDADGNVTTRAFNAGGEETSITNPSYTAPGSTTPVHGATTMAYNSLGEETSSTDPLGNATTMTYDQLGDLATRTDPGGAAWTYTYDTGGEQLSVTDPTGARTQATYNNLGQLVTSTDIVRQNASAAYTTTYGYNAGGEQTSQTSPTGVTTGTAYDALGEETSSTDGAGNSTTYSYNLDGDVAKITAPDGTAITEAYDLAGRQTSLSDLSATGTVLRSESVGYNGDGNVTSATNFLGNTATASYNALGELTSQSEPVSASHVITTSYGYDLDGNQTALTDGNGNTTYTTYNSLGLPQAVTEPTAGSYASAANSTTTDGYDGDGDLVTQTLPGGAQVTNTYDARGDLTGQSGSRAGAPTATRTFTYDTAGRMLTAATSAAGTQGNAGYQPATSESFSYDDRGLLLSASGSAGTSAYAYNGSGQLTSDTNTAGTSTYTYDSVGRLATDTDAASGTTGTYSYNSLDQVTKIAYGTGNDTQSFGYDSLHRLVSDAIATASGTQVAAIDYAYDADNDVTSMTTSGLATAGGGTGTVANTYGYDEAGRLTSWTATPSGGSAATTSYGYDNDGNLTSNNSTTYTYNARDQLTSASTGASYTYAADGDLTSQTGGSAPTATFTSDAYGQLVTGSSASYTHDGLGRLISVGNQDNATTTAALTYDGMTDGVASDPSATYSRDPSGQIVGVDTTAGGRALALDDEHDDLSGTFTAASTTLTGSTTYSPWGTVLASTGPQVQVGYQGQWTDPANQQVSMGSRFYTPSTGGFASQDTDPSDNGLAVSDNLYAYADDNPMSVTDPTGHSPAGDDGTGGTVTKADVAAAQSRAQETAQVAARAATAAAEAKATAGNAESTAAAAASYASQLNSDATQLLNKANATSQKAQQDFNAAQAALADAQTWQSKANSLQATEQAEMQWAKSHWCLICIAAVAASDAILSPLLNAYQSNAQAAMNQYYGDEAAGGQLQEEADTQYQDYALLHAQAVAASDQSRSDAVTSADDLSSASYLAGVAARDEQIAANAQAEYQRLLKQYESEQKKSADSCDLKCKIKKAIKKLIKGAATVAAGAAGAAAGGAAGGGASGGAVGGVVAAGGTAVGVTGTIIGEITSAAANADFDQMAAKTGLKLSQWARVGIGAFLGGATTFGSDWLHGARDWVTLTRDTTIGSLTGGLGGIPDGGAAAVIAAGGGGFTNAVATQIFRPSGPANLWQVPIDTLMSTGLGLAGVLLPLGDVANTAITAVPSVLSGICDPSNVVAHSPWC